MKNRKPTNPAQTDETIRRGDTFYVAYWWHGRDPEINAYTFDRWAEREVPGRPGKNRVIETRDGGWHDRWFHTLDAAREHIRHIARTRIAWYEKTLTDDIAATVLPDQRWLNARGMAIDMRTGETVPLR